MAAPGEHMSDLQDDKKLVETGRRNKLKGVEAPLRDQIVHKLFDKCDELEIADKAVKMWTTANSERGEWLERRRAFLANWDQHLIADHTGPFKGSSNLHIPMPMWVCKTFHARFVQTLEDFVCKARNAGSVEREHLVKEFMSYTLSDWINHYQGVSDSLDKWVWDWVTEGRGILKQRWDIKYTRYIDVEMVAQKGPPKFDIDENGKEVVQPTTVMVEKEVPRTKKCFDGPVAERVHTEDFVMIGGDDPQTCDAVQHRHYLTASELWQYVDRGVFDEDAVEEMIKGGQDTVSGSTASGIKQDRADNAGLPQLDTAIDQDRYEVLESYMKVDVDGSGISSDIVVWVAVKARKLLRATYLYRINQAGERPFFLIDFQRRGQDGQPVGLVELLYPLSKELDAHHNMRIDFGLLSVMPFGFYRPTSNIEPETLDLSPGALIPVDNPQSDVFFPNLGNRTAFGFQEEAAIMTMVERLTSISDLSLGIIGGQGATRTATGTRAIVGEASANLDVYLKRLNVGWKKFLKHLLHQLQARTPAGVEFKVLGQNGYMHFAKLSGGKDLAGDFDVEVSGASANSNKQIQMETAREVLTLTSNPLDIQLGIITPQNRYEAVKNWLQVLGIKDFSRFCNAAFSQRVTLTPQEEADKVLRGSQVPVLPDGDHEGFIAYFQEFLNDDQLIGQFTEEQTVLLAQQAQKHADMLAAMQEMAAQAANSRQMQANAANSQQQAPTGMGPMAGAMGTQGQ